MAVVRSSTSGPTVPRMELMSSAHLALPSFNMISAADISRQADRIRTKAMPNTAEYSFKARHLNVLNPMKEGNDLVWPEGRVVGLGSPVKFAALCGVAWVMVLGNSMLIPVLPQMGRAMQLSQLESGLIITSFSVGAGLTIPVFGFWADHVGRKAIIVPSLVLFGLAGALAGLSGLLLSSPFVWILAARFVQGIGAGGTYQLAMTLTGDIFQQGERTRALGYLESANGLGKVSAPLIGSALGALLWFLPFMFYLVASLPVALSVWWAISEPGGHLEQRPVGIYLGQVRRAVRRQKWALVGCFTLGLAALFLYFGMLSYLSDLLERRHGITGLYTGLVITVPVGAMAVSALLSSRYLSLLPRSRLRWGASGGLALAVVFLGLAAFLVDPILLVGAITGMSVGNGVALASLNSLVTGAVGKGTRGLVVSIYATVRHVGAATGPPAFGLLAMSREQTALLWFSLIGLALVVPAGLVIRGDILKPESASRRGDGI